MSSGIEKIRRHKLVTQFVCEAALFVVVAALVIHVASSAKRGEFTLPLAASVEPVAENRTAPAPRAATQQAVAAEQHLASPEVTYEVEELETTDLDIRWFDGRKVRPARTIWMTVTAYSPDHRSCGHWADGRTATNTSVWRHGMELVAADTRLLPFGSMLSVPGYANEKIVPVLDRGGAIKGARLDVLYATHSEARVWGVQKLPVTVWEFVEEDDQPALGG
ncbi:MAG: 3D domain-containing protein [Planctomycetota bacterium]